MWNRKPMLLATVTCVGVEVKHSDECSNFIPGSHLVCTVYSMEFDHSDLFIRKMPCWVYFSYTNPTWGIWKIWWYEANIKRNSSLTTHHQTTVWYSFQLRHNALKNDCREISLTIMMTPQCCMITSLVYVHNNSNGIQQCNKLLDTPKKMFTRWHTKCWCITFHSQGLCYCH